MTNSKLLIRFIEKCGFTREAFADKLGISRQSLHKKLCNRTEFRQSEIKKTTQLLNLTSEQEKEIFFADFVD